MAFDQRFAMGLIASSGAGGTKLYRRNFGESLENLASSGAYHWMAGNYIKYSAEEATFGRRTAENLPVDSHMTLALCAPRLTFISHGIPEKGDAKWLDHQGSFMAAIAAQPVFRLLGAHDLRRSDDYKTEKMPGVNVDMLDGELAWRQHDGGHTDEPNVEHFIKWADKHFATAYGKEATDKVSRRVAAPSREANRSQLNQSPRAASGQGKARQNRRLLRRRLDHATMGRNRLSRIPRAVEKALLRPQCGQLWLGRRHDSEHSLAPAKRRARWRLTQGDRAPGRHKQPACDRICRQYEGR